MFGNRASTSAFARYVALGLAALALCGLLGSCGSNLFDRFKATSGPQQVNTEKGEWTRLDAEESLEAPGFGIESYSAADCYWEPDPFNTEEYAFVREGGFISTATRPLSTISADVDTASYCNFRRMVQNGYFADEISPGAIRIEEMLNYFTYDYALPSGKELFGATVQAADCPWNPDTKLLVMGFATAPEQPQVKGSNLVFLIDVSGSMDSYDKLDLLKESFAELTGQLGANDRVSIVTYADGEDVVLDGARGDEKRKIMRAIGRLNAGGSTNGEAGLMMAYRVAQDNFIEGGVNRIVLASDGDLNVGMTDEASLEDYVAKQRDTGIYLSVLGFGEGNYKDNKMETIADNGNGNYHYIDCLTEAQKVFGRDLTANLVPLADDVKLQVEFNPAQVKAYRLIGYENRALDDEEFADDAADAGEVGPGHQFTVAYEVALADSKLEVGATELKYAANEKASDNASDEWLTCSIRYKPAGESASKLQSFVVDAADLTSEPSADWRFAAALIEAGMVLRGSDYAGSATLESAQDLLDPYERDIDRAEFAELLYLLNEGGWRFEDDLFDDGHFYDFEDCEDCEDHEDYEGYGMLID